MIRLLIADDHTMFRKGLREILKNSTDMAVAGEAKSGPEILKKVQKGGIDLVILDISMPGMHGLDVLKQLKVSKSSVRILVLSMYPEEQYAVRCLRAGASGYLTKDKTPEDLIRAIRKVGSGHSFISEALAERMADTIGVDPGRPLHEILSDREYQVAQLLASGKTVKEIGHLLTLSVKTVSTYRRRSLVKMKMKSNAELMRYMIENGLING